jgi:serine/threonine protein phosphatase PrpC
MPPAYHYSRVLASGRCGSEDRAEVFERGDDLVIVVADGAGGMLGGAAASEALVDAVRARLLDCALDLRDVMPWVRIFREADERLATQAAGETTGVVVALTGRGVVGVSAGDSEAWVISAASMDDLTSSQVKHRIGSGRAEPVTFHRPTLNGTLLAATDGLFKYAAPEKIVTLANSGAVPDLGHALAGLVRLRSGAFQDDVGIVVVASALPPSFAP